MASRSHQKFRPLPSPAWKWKPWWPSQWPPLRCTTCARPWTRVSPFAKSYWNANPAERAETSSAAQRRPSTQMPNNVKVLIVDDNPMVLGMLQKALAPLAAVTTSTDAADALLKAIDGPPDLLVS